MVTRNADSVSLSRAMSKKSIYRAFSVWLVGDTPLIVHAWSHKAKQEMLSKQVKAVKPGKEPRDPERDFVDSLYEMGEGAGVYGFPATGVKNCLLSAAHKDKGMPRTSVMAAVFLDAEMVSVRPALAGAMCDMPLVRVWGSAPQMREDTVKIGAGLNKTANLAYRGQFSTWAVRVKGRFNESILSADTLGLLLSESGVAYGLGEWRNERKGMFGAFHMADEDEETAWEAFAAGKGDLPVPAAMKMAAE